jgi:hypothetical protein
MDALLIIFDDEVDSLIEKLKMLRSLPGEDPESY